MSKHTPGPWKIVRRLSAPGVVVGGVERQYANGTVQDQLFMVCPAQEDNGGNEATEANARLIAAAPDLLEALELAADFLEHSTEFRIGHPGFEGAQAKARAAIAKVEEA